MEGPMRVETRNPKGVHLLHPGETCAVGPNTPHFVEGEKGGCKFMIVHGVGPYDYISVEDEP